MAKVRAIDEAMLTQDFGRIAELQVASMKSILTRCETMSHAPMSATQMADVIAMRTQIQAEADAMGITDLNNTRQSREQYIDSIVRARNVELDQAREYIGKINSVLEKLPESHPKYAEFTAFRTDLEQDMDALRHDIEECEVAKLRWAHKKL